MGLENVRLLQRRVVIHLALDDRPLDGPHEQHLRFFGGLRRVGYIRQLSPHG